MIHFTCDRCKRSIDEHEVRYILELEARATVEPCENDEVDDRDQLNELQEILERLEDADCAGIEQELYQRKRFDLCPECYRQYIQNPFGIETSLQLNFSSN